MIERLLSTASVIETAQLLVLSVLFESSDNGVQKTYPGKLGVAKNETSGDKRTLAAPDTVTFCQVGRGNPVAQAVFPVTLLAQLLAPPPLDEIPTSAWAAASVVIGIQPGCAVLPP